MSKIGTHHNAIDYKCTFTDGDNGGEIPYVLLNLDGCDYRVNGLNGIKSYWNETLTCTGDSIGDVGFRACQTHGGLLPDDCTNRDWFEVTPGALVQKLDRELAAQPADGGPEEGQAVAEDIDDLE